MTQNCTASGDGWRCDRLQQRTDLCQPHYQQRLRNPDRAFKPIQKQRKPRKVERHDPNDMLCRIPEGHQRCTYCDEVLPLGMFYKDAKYGAFRTQCRNCNADYTLERNYGVGAAEWKKRKLEEQGGVCAGCGTDDPNHKYGWQLDHDHEKGEWRHVLCFTCNLCLDFVEKNDWDAQAFADFIARRRR